MAHTKRSRRTYAYYERMGQHLSEAQRHLDAAGIVGQTGMTKDTAEYQTWIAIQRLLTHLMAVLDDQYCEDIRVDQIPPGKPVFPLYPDPPTEELPPIPWALLANN